ncbi:MAG: hypothetical protein ACOX56_04250 [Acholeplasmataceae bacterium]
MKVKVKTYSKIERIIYRVINITLIVSFFALYLAYILIKGKNAESEILGILATIIISVFGIFVTLNLTIISIDSLTKKKMEKKLKEYQKQEKYQEAIDYLLNLANKKTLYNLSQRIIHYLAYFSLLLDNQEEALYYLSEFDIDQQKVVNLDCVILILFLNYIIGFINQNETMLVKARLDYVKQKPKVLKHRPSISLRQVINLLFEIIDLMENNEIKTAMEKLTKFKFSDIPMIAKFIEANK